MPRAVQSWFSWSGVPRSAEAKLPNLCRARPRAELKHISKPRKRNQNEIPPVAASEKGSARPEFQLWVCAVNGGKVALNGPGNTVVLRWPPDTSWRSSTA